MTGVLKIFLLMDSGLVFFRFVPIPSYPQFLPLEQSPVLPCYISRGI